MSHHSRFEFQFVLYFILLFVIITIYACAQGSGNLTHLHSDANKWTLVYKNDYDGKTLFGSKDDLIYALRSGSPLRIGYGGHRQGDTLRSIEHIAEAQFVSIANSNEVFAQIATNIGQDPSLGEEPLTMKFHEDRKFSMIACTNGTASSLSIDFKIDSLRTSNPSRRGFYWYVQQGNLKDNSQFKGKEMLVEPLWKNPRKR